MGPIQRNVFILIVYVFGGRGGGGGARRRREKLRRWLRLSLLNRLLLLLSFRVRGSGRNGDGEGGFGGRGWFAGRRSLGPDRRDRLPRSPFEFAVSGPVAEQLHHEPTIAENPLPALVQAGPLTRR